MGKVRTIPYGYTVRNGKTIIEPNEARCIRKIFSDYINGASLKDIADDLTESQIPITIKACCWDKARVARILENAKYTGDGEYDPIIGEDIFELALECKKSRTLAASESCSREIEVIRSRVKCELCGHPMARRINNNNRIRESWHCQNPACKATVAICDFELSEKVRILMNRVIQNANLMIPTPKAPKQTNPEMDRLKESLNSEIRTSNPSESLILELIGRMASEEYRANCSRDAIASRLAKQRVQIMQPQNTFNETYFNDIVKTVLLSDSESKVRIITKTDTEITDKENAE